MVKLRVFLAAALFAVFAFSLFLPLPARAEVGEGVVCHWADGTVTEERFADFYSALVAPQEEGILLVRDGLSGRVDWSEAGARAYAALEKGTVAELLDLRTDDLPRAERAALTRGFSDRSYFFFDTFFFWDGRQLVPKIRTCREAVLFEPVRAQDLIALGATCVWVRGEFSADCLIGSSVAVLKGEAPYYAEGNGLYLRAGGVRFVAAPPVCRELTVGEVDFLDAGALAACGELESLELPFAGSARTYFEGYEGRIAALFSENVPKSLSRVKVRSGLVALNAFHGLEEVREIDLCGIPETDIEATFSGLGFETLHTRKSLNLEDCTKKRASCGCFIYTREKA